MLNNIYQLFYKKLPDSLEQVLPEYNRCKLITCLNPHYLISLEACDYELYKEFDFICSDGMGPLILNNIFGKTKSIRLSFDISSMAGPVFRDLIKHDEGLFLIGSEPGDAEKSANIIRQSFSGLRILGCHHGFIKGHENEIINQIIQSGAKVVIIGMGAPLQDKFALKLKKSGFSGTAYTCGGFIHQTTETMVSFPEWTNRFKLRWLYRIFTQKGVFNRFIKCIPLFVITYSWFLLNKCETESNK